MAKSKTAAPAFAVAPSATPLAKSARGGEAAYVATPFDETIENAESGQAFDVNVESGIDEDGKSQADAAVSLLNKSVRHFGRYLRVRYLTADRDPVKRGADNIAIVQFEVKDEPSREVRFTADDIRTWAVLPEVNLPTTGGGKSGNAIPAETRAAFWEAVAQMDASDTDETSDSGESEAVNAA